MEESKKRATIQTGSGWNQVSQVMYWYRNGHFRNEDEAKGAFRLAHQQGLDGMGQGVREWMGMTSAEFDAWMRRDELPKKSG